MVSIPYSHPQTAPVGFGFPARINEHTHHHPTQATTTRGYAACVLGASFGGR